MLYQLHSKSDVLTMLYAIGHGRGIPRRAVEFLAPFIDFLPADKPSSHTVFRIENATTHEVLVEEETPNYQPRMFCDPRSQCFEPELDDFELKFALPAVAFGHFEEGFDRTGDATIAMFDIASLAQLGTPKRFQIRSRLIDVFGYLSPETLGLNPDALQAKADWLNTSSEDDVRAQLTSHFGRPLSTDEELAPIVTSFDNEFSFFLTFLREGDWEMYERSVDGKKKVAAREASA